MSVIEKWIKKLNKIEQEKTNKLSLSSEGSMGPVYKFNIENFEFALKCIKNSQH